MLEMFLLLIATVLHVLDRGIYYCQLVVYHLLVCIRNAKKLIFMLTHGTKTWIYMLVRLILFTLVLAPGWYNLLKYWFLDSFILRNVEYGKGARARNMLDIYLPLPLDIVSQLKSDTKVYSDGAPVVIFVSGGAWIIGYKLWSALVGRALASLGILTIAPDYRNFPQGDIQDMTQDIRNAILWTERNCSRFGGNPDKIILAGQSAGAHICLCLLVDEFLSMKLPKETKEEAEYHAKLDLNYKIFEEMVDPSHRHSGKDLPTVASNIISGRIGSPTKHHQQQPLKPQSPLLPSLPESGLGFARQPSTSEKTDYKKPLLPPTPGSSSKKTKNEITPSQEDEFGAPEDGVEEEEVEEVVELEDEEEGDKELEEGNDDEDSDTFHSSTPYSDHSFQNYPIYPMNQRKKNLLEKAILKQALGEGDKRLNDDEGTEPEKEDTETEEEWFGTPFEQNKTPLGSVYSSTGSPKKSAMKPTKPVDLIDHDEEEAEKENREQGKHDDDEFDSSFEDESNNPGGIWKDVPGISEKKIHNNKSSKKPKNSSNNKNDNDDDDLSPLISSSSNRKHFTPTPSNKSNRKSPYTSSSKKLNNTNSSSKRSSRRLSRESSSMSVCSNSLNEPIRITEKIKLFIGVSGPYNLQALESHLHKRGLDSSILHWICRGNLAECSPTVKLQQYVMEELLKLKELNKEEERETVEGEQQQQSQETEENKDDDSPSTTSHTVTAVAVTAVPLDSTTSSSSKDNKKSDNNDDWSNWWILNFIHSELMIYWKKLFPDWMTASSSSSSSLRPVSSSSYTPAGDHYNPNGLNSNDDVLIDQSLTSSVLSVTSSLSLKNKKTDCLSDFLPVALFHGSKDLSIPDSISKELSEVLSSHGASVIYKCYEDWTHTDAILEAPLYGNIKLFKDMIQIIRQVTEFNSAIFHNQKNRNNNNKDGNIDDKPQFTRKQRALSFPADYFKLPVAKQLALDDERKNKDGKKKKSSSKEKPNPSEVPLAPKFLLNIGRKLNPF
jgi:acetyl esterase/lipase